MQIEVPESEVVDRITILELKASRLDGAAAEEAEARAGALGGIWAQHHGPLGEEPELATLRTINGALWDVEDALRAHEAEGRFDETFVELARSVYRLNDQRAACKRRIDERLGSRWREHKGFGRVRDSG